MCRGITPIRLPNRASRIIHHHKLVLIYPLQTQAYPLWTGSDGKIPDISTCCMTPFIRRAPHVWPLISRRFLLLRLIKGDRHAQAMGFSLGEIGELLSLRAAPAADCGKVREHAASKLAEVDRKLGELHRMRAALEVVVAACPARGALRRCTILEALEGTAMVQEPARGVPRNNRTRRKSGMKSITLKIEGMHCDGCAQTIEALVGAEEGVKAIAVTYKTGEARILFDPARTSEAKLIALIKRPGFRVAGTSPS